MVKKRILSILLVSLVLLMTAGGGFAATINIDADKTVGINPLIYGNNMNVGSGDPTSHGSNVSTGWGAWDPNGASAKDGKSVQEVVYFAQDAGITILRFPGGNLAKEYPWSECIGPYVNRSTSTFRGWDVSDNKYGTDEHMAFSEDVGAEVMITVNAVTGTAEEAAAWVAYLNGSPNDTRVVWDGNTVGYWASLRGDPNYANHPAPYNVKYWEIDNEVWDDYDMDLAKYVNDCNEFYDAMKAVDPTIKIGAVLAGQFGWQNTIIESLGDKIDFVIYHSYNPGAGQNALSESVNDVFEAILAAPYMAQQMYTGIRNIIESSPGSKARAQDIELFITEYNTNLMNNETDPNYQYSLGSALQNAEMLNIFMVPDNKVGAANVWELKSYVFGQVEGLVSPYTVRPNQYVYEMYTDYFSTDLVKTTVISDTNDTVDINGLNAYSVITSYKTDTDDAKFRVRLQRRPGTNISGDIWYDDLMVRESSSDDNMLTNGDFEDGFNSGWTHTTDPPGVTSSIDSTVSRSGTKSFKLSFADGNDPDYYGMYQDVNVLPNTRYEIGGYLKTQGIDPEITNLVVNPGFEDG